MMKTTSDGEPRPAPFRRSQRCDGTRGPRHLIAAGTGHYDGNPETYMNVGEAMGKAMVELLKNK